MLPAVAIQVERNLPRIKVLKLHGDVHLGVNYMTSSETIGYEQTIGALVKSFSARPALVCGYSFYHRNVLNAFSTSGGPFYYVNRSFPETPMVLSLMKARSKRPLYIDEPLGPFYQFMAALAKELP